MARVKDFWKRFIETDYHISRNGDVLSLKVIPAKLLRPSIDKDGYKRVDLCFGSRKSVKHFHVHKLVAECWIPNPESKPQVNHKDCNKTNNKLSNLEWCTLLENVKHAHANGRGYHPTGEKNVQSKLKEGDILKIRKLCRLGHTVGKVALSFNVSHSTISEIKSRKIWTHL